MQIYLVVVVVVVVLENDNNWSPTLMSERERERVLFTIFFEAGESWLLISLSFDEASLLLVLLESCSSLLRFLLS